MCILHVFYTHIYIHIVYIVSKYRRPKSKKTSQKPIFFVFKSVKHFETIFNKFFFLQNNFKQFSTNSFFSKNNLKNNLKNNSENCGRNVPKKHPKILKKVKIDTLFLKSLKDSVPEDAR